MPLICEFKCDKCGFTLPKGWGGYMYVEDDKGEKIVCSHPGEAWTVSKVLRIEKRIVSWGLAGKLEKFPEISDPERKRVSKLLEERVGFNSHCLCLDCLNQFDLDIQKEERICPKCQSKNVKTELKLVGKPCPKCKKGIIGKISTGSIS